MSANLSGARPFASVVIPVYNEAGNAAELAGRLKTVFDGLKWTCEIIFVDDGSVDKSVDVLKKLHQDDGRIKIVSLARNFGHQQALTAGLDHAAGEVIITMDGDLQHPPELLPQLIEKYKEGYDVVNTLRTYPTATGWMKSFSSKLFYAVVNRFSSILIQPNAADFRLLSRRANDALAQLHERNRFIRGLVSWIGFKQISISYQADKRKSGVSKFSFYKMVRFALDGLTSFSTVPLYLAIYCGLAISLFSFAYLIWILYFKLFTTQAVTGWASIVFMVSFLGGIQLLCIGIIGEYLGRIYMEIKQRPIYLVREYIGINPPPSAQC